MRVPLLNFEGFAEFPLLNFERGPGSRFPRSPVLGSWYHFYTIPFEIILNFKQKTENLKTKTQKHEKPKHCKKRT